MPELPDVEVFRKEAEKCKDSEIDHIKVYDAKFVKQTEGQLNKSFSGKHFKKIIRRGKFLFLTTENNVAVVLHFGMTGNLKYLNKNEEPPEYTRCSFEFKNKHNLHVTSRRKLGHLEMTADATEFINKKGLGPDALGVSKSEFWDMLKNKNSMLKTALTDQTLIAGIGNVYGDEILYQAKLHPRQKTNLISEKEMNNLFEEMNRVLNTAIEKNAEVSKMPKEFLLPVREKGNSCPGCKGKLDIIKISGRTTYYCPSCQKI